METTITKLIKECEELIQAYYSPHALMRIEDLYEKFEVLNNLTKDKYPIYNEEFASAAKIFFRNKSNHSMGYICCVLSIIKTEEYQYIEYISNDRILELKNISNLNYDTTKLLQFCIELNHAYNKKSFLTIPLLVRAVIDHIPPIFEKENFAAVCGGYGTRSFQESMTHLNNSLRKIADSTIHTQIRNKETLPNEIQVNFKADLDVLLAEICRVLR